MIYILEEILREQMIGDGSHLQTDYYLYLVFEVLASFLVQIRTGMLTKFSNHKFFHEPIRDS